MKAFVVHAVDGRILRSGAVQDAVLKLQPTIQGETLLEMQSMVDPHKHMIVQGEFGPELAAKEPTP